MRSVSLNISTVFERSSDEARSIVSHRGAQIRGAVAAVVTDLVALTLAWVVVSLLSLTALGLEASVGGTVLVSLTPLVLLGFLVTGLYSPLFVHPAQEIKLAIMTVGVVGAVSTGFLAISGAPVESLVHTAAASAILLFVMPVTRSIARIYLSKTSWWGMPVLIFGDDRTSERVVELLQRWPELGFDPSVVVQEGAARKNEIDDVPVITDRDEAPRIAKEHSIGCAIVAMPQLNHHELGHLLDNQGKYFKHMFVVPKAGVAQCMWSTSQSYDGLVGFSVQHYSWHRWVRSLKGVVDRVAALIGILLTLPLLLIVAAWIKLDSKGPVFFVQERMGRQGRCFNVIKFRTMYEDAEERLGDLLEANPELAEEYRLYHKLQDDPRVTDVGEFLRRYSLDELPQLFNVLRGEMSLVGPRAYMPSELSKMNGMSRAVLQSPPGLTGLWQVSGRNHLSFEERVDLDVHYLQNWSPWLDLYILARTLPVVTSGEGAQ